MTQDLTNSTIERQDIFNNPFLLDKIKEYLSLKGLGLDFERESFFTKQQVRDLFEISENTLEKYLTLYRSELPSDTKVSIKGVLSLAMLVTESEKAKEIRSHILDIIIDAFAQKMGGFINPPKIKKVQSPLKHNFNQFLEQKLAKPETLAILKRLKDR